MLLLIANPGSPRAQRVAEAARALDLSLSLLPYINLLRGTARLDARLHELRHHPRLLVRFDSPGGDHDVERLLLTHGAQVLDPLTRCSRLPLDAVDDYRFVHGQLRFPRQAFLGWRRLLHELHPQLLTAPPHTHLLNAPLDIAAMFDKPLSHQRMSRAGVPVPKALPAQDIEHLDALDDAMRERHWDRVFVKLANGSSAVGVIAIERLSSGELRGITSMRIARRLGELHFFNSLRLSTYTDRHALAQAVGYVLDEGAHIERWIPKVQLQPGRPTDVRVLVVNDHAAHRVLRIGNSPMTNLHLGNDRDAPETLQKHVGEEAWSAGLQAAVHAKALFPTCLYAGVDLLFAQHDHTPAIIEINAFGDFLNNATFQGMGCVEYLLRQTQ